MCSFGELDPREVWRETPRKARKQHQCDSCGVVIQPSEHYLSHFSAVDGTGFSEACCALCWMIREDFVEAHGQYFAPSTLWDTLQECIGENDDPEDEWRQLLAVIKRRYRTAPAGRAALRRHWRHPVRLPHHLRERSPWEEWQLPGHLVTP